MIWFYQESSQKGIETYVARMLKPSVAEWLRRSVSNHARSTRVGSNPVVGTINHKPIDNSAVHPSDVGK